MDIEDILKNVGIDNYAIHVDNSRVIVLIRKSLPYTTIRYIYSKIREVVRKLNEDLEIEVIANNIAYKSSKTSSCSGCPLKSLCTYSDGRYP